MSALLETKIKCENCGALLRYKRFFLGIVVVVFWQILLLIPLWLLVLGKFIVAFISFGIIALGCVSIILILPLEPYDRSHQKKKEISFD